MSSTLPVSMLSASSAAIGQQTNTLGKDEFMQLLVTQLQNQDPLNPMDDQQFISQMAQLSALEATSNLAGQVGQMVAGQQQTQALQMVGHDIEFADATGNTQRGRVSGVHLAADGPILLVGDYNVPVGAVQTVL